jgi:hypothetical protein
MIKEQVDRDGAVDHTACRPDEEAAECRAGDDDRDAQAMTDPHHQGGDAAQAVQFRISVLI